jgi:hypothetical protein
MSMSERGKDDRLATVEGALELFRFRVAVLRGLMIESRRRPGTDPAVRRAYEGLREAKVRLFAAIDALNLRGRDEVEARVLEALAAESGGYVPAGHAAAAIADEPEAEAA